MFTRTYYGIATTLQRITVLGAAGLGLVAVVFGVLHNNLYSTAYWPEGTLGRFLSVVGGYAVCCAVVCAGPVGAARSGHRRENLRVA